MALERLVIAAFLIMPEPPGRGRARALRQRGLERRERTADMVEHSVQDDAKATPSGLGHQMVEVLLVAEARIYPEVVGGVVSVGLGREDRPEQQA